MADERNAESVHSSPWRGRLWGIAWLLLAAGLFQGVWLGGRAEARERETWRAVTASVVSSAVAYDVYNEQYELHVRLEAELDGRILHGELPKRRGKQGDLERDLEREFPLGAAVECLVDPARPDRLVVPPAHGAGPLLMGLLPAILFALIGSKLLFGSRPETESA